MKIRGSLVFTSLMHKINIRRVLRNFLIIVIPTWLVLWGVASIAAPMVVSWVIPKLQGKAKSMGVVVDQIEYENIRVSPWLTSVTANQVSMSFGLVPGNKQVLLSSFRCDAIRIALGNPFKMSGSVQIAHFETQFHKTDMPEEFPFDSFTDGQLELTDMPLLSPRNTVREILAGVITLFNDNQVDGDFNFSGKVQIKVNQKNVPARIYTEGYEGVFRLRFSEEDVRTVAREMQLVLADDQVDMVSHYPLRIPVIAYLTEKARHYSLQYFAPDIWKQDALRHTMWSYMLTDAFGPEFAKMVTDAQETKPGNEHYERLMDYNNNAVGRALVAEKVKFEEIPRRVIQDRRIILSPEDAKSRPVNSLLR